MIINNIDLIFRRALDYEQAFDIVQYKLAQSQRSRIYEKLNNASREYIKGYLSACWANLASNVIADHHPIVTEHTRYVYKRFGEPFTSYCKMGINPMIEI